MPLIETPVYLSIEKILLATDFSLPSEKAADYAKALARRFNSTVDVAHCFNPSVVISPENATLGYTAQMKEQLASEAVAQTRAVRLIVLDRGRIVEQGDHRSLLARDGLYARLWARQSGGFLGDDVADAAADRKSVV